MPLYIRYEKVRELAARVAKAWRTSLTDAVRCALEREVSALERDEQARDRQLRARFAWLDALPRRDFGDDEMYDERGLPRSCGSR